MHRQLLHERDYFLDLSKFSEQIIANLTDKVKSKDKINSGDSFVVEMDDTHDLEIKFYKTYSRRARNFLATQSNSEGKVSALFFPIPSDKADGTIEIYINNAKTYYYKDRDSIEIVNSRLPKFIKDILRHEISHAHETITADFANDKPDFTRDKEGNVKNLTMDEYRNADEEVNAVFNHTVMAEIQDNNLIKYYISVGDADGAMKTLVLKINSDPHIHAMSDKSKKWIMKTAYTTIKKLVDKHSID